MLNPAHALPSRGAWRAVVALSGLLCLCLASRDANAAAVAGLNGSIGLVAALLALLALQGQAAQLSAASLAVGLLLVALATLAWRRAAPAAAGEPSLLVMARERFVRLQAAWDRADIDALRALTTDDMLDELLAQLPERGPGPNRTDVLSLEARLIAHESLGALELASIEFSGVVRESPERGAAPFREIWMLARERGESDWRLARQQALL